VAEWRVGVLVIGALAAGWAPVARAQSLPGAGGFLVSASGGGAGVESHGWAVVPEDRAPRSIVLHIPPRGVSAPGGGVVPDGAIARAATIDQAPEQIAAWDATVYLAFPPQIARPGERRRRVLSVTASRAVLVGGGGGAWEFDAGERLNAAPSMPGTGPLLGFVGSPRGPVALLDETDWGGLTLLVLTKEEWRRVPLPGGEIADGPAPSLAPPPILVATPRGPALFIRDRSRPGVWIADLPEKPVGGAASAEQARGAEPAELGPTEGPSWTWLALPFGEGAAASISGPVFQVRGRFVVADRSGPGSLTLWSAGGTGMLELARLDGLPTGYSVAPLEQTGRIVLVCPERVDAPTPPGARLPPGGAGVGGGGRESPAYEYHVREVSALTGQVLYAGKPTGTSPVSPAEFRILVLLLLGVTVAIMVFVLRPTGPGGSEVPLVLPARAALAEPGRRIAAAVLDLAPAMLLASKLSGVPLGELWSAEGLLGGDALVLTLDSLGLAFVHTVLCEWLFRRSLGKVLAGCEAVQVVLRPAPPEGVLQPEAVRPALWRAVVRNLIKWGLAPVALPGLASPDRRHLGDRLSGMVVVVQTSPQEAAGGA
jgi:hypothetical protein